jgi:hypothetical protein
MRWCDEQTGGRFIQRNKRSAKLGIFCCYRIIFFVANSSFAGDAPVLYFFHDKHLREYDDLHTRVRVYDTVWGHKFSGLREIVCVCRHHKIHSWTRTTIVFLRPSILLRY